MERRNQDPIHPIVPFQNIVCAKWGLQEFVLGFTQAIKGSQPGNKNTSLPFCEMLAGIGTFPRILCNAQELCSRFRGVSQQTNQYWEDSFGRGSWETGGFEKYTGLPPVYYLCFYSPVLPLGRREKAKTDSPSSAEQMHPHWNKISCEHSYTFLALHFLMNRDCWLHLLKWKMKKRTHTGSGFLNNVT